MSPLSLAFDKVEVGLSSDAKIVALSNTGNGPLTINGISASGDFAQTNSCGGSVAAGGSCTITVTFKPTAADARTGSVSVASSASGSPHSVALSGTGIVLAPSVRVSPPSLTFATRDIGSTSPAETVTLSNTGDGALSINSIAASGDFSQSNSCGNSVAAGASCTISVSFTPTAAGNRNGTITITDNAAGSPHSVSLIGGGKAAGPAVSLSISPASVVQDKPATVAVALSNANASPMSLAGFSVSLPDGLVVAAPANASVSAPCSGSVSAMPGAGSFSTPGLILPTTGGCNLSVDVTSAAVGDYTVAVAAGAISGQVNATPVSNAEGASATLKVSSSKVPLLSVSPSTLSFGKQRVGTTSEAQSVKITNTGGADLLFAAPAFSASGDFTQSSNCPSILAPTVSCTVSVTFVPGASGERSGQLTIASNAASSPDAVALSGTGEALPAPNVSLSPASLSFPAQTLGTSSAPQAVTMTNTGTASLSITQIVAAAGDFSSSTTCGASLGAGASCSFTVTFTPLLSGSRTGSISINNNASGSPHTIALSGVGSEPARPNIGVDPSSIAFGSQLAGTTGVGRQVTIRNSGGMTLELRAIEIVGAGFALASACPPSLAPGASCTATVAFAPPTAESHAANIRILTNAAPAMTVVGLSGQGVAVPAGRLSGSPGSIAFNDQIVGTTSAPQAFAITNGGSAPASISRISVTGDFALEGSCSVLAPGESCALRVTFTPAAAGSASGQVIVESDAANTAMGISLAGNGIPVPAPKVSLSATALTFGNTLIGSSSTQSVTVTNTGAAVLAFGGVEGTGEYHAGNGCIAPLSPGESCRITVEFAPRIPGDRVGELRIRTNAENSPQTIGVAGVGCRFALRGRSFALVCAP